MTSKGTSNWQSLKGFECNDNSIHSNLTQIDASHFMMIVKNKGIVSFDTAQNEWIQLMEIKGLTLSVTCYDPISKQFYIACDQRMLIFNTETQNKI